MSAFKASSVTLITSVNKSHAKSLSKLGVPVLVYYHSCASKERVMTMGSVHNHEDIKIQPNTKLATTDKTVCDQFCVTRKETLTKKKVCDEIIVGFKIFLRNAMQLEQRSKNTTLSIE